jgi:hypothetical protein
MLLQTPSIPADVEVQKLLTYVHIDEWLREDVFQLKWWFLLGMLIFAAVAWWKLLDRARLPEIILYAVLATIGIIGIDEYGEELTAWAYPTEISPIFSIFTTINLAAVPIVFSLIYQRFKTWSSFTGATLVMAGILSFVFEPALTWGGFFQLLTWKYYYSFAVYIILALLIRWVVVKIFVIAEQAKKRFKQCE